MLRYGDLLISKVVVIRHIAFDLKRSPEVKSDFHSYLRINLGPRLAQCGMSRDLPSYQVAP